MGLFSIYNTAKNASMNSKTPTTWMFVKQQNTGWPEMDGETGWTADESTVGVMDRAGCLIAFRFDNGVKTAGLHD